ncbi:MAG: RHS repeat-associated core domain-containing protein, partial [Acidobacteria bacterium]|nr:RHS repeat-associated core domain-containing protein [Acidobacteriota bacterium]
NTFTMQFLLVRRTPAHVLQRSVCFFGKDSSGKERDETGLDYFGARYLSSALGRWTSPDPLLSSGRPWIPQTWNRYTYGRNNPLTFVDPTGLYDRVNNCGDDSKCNKEFKDAAKN